MKRYRAILVAAALVLAAPAASFAQQSATPTPSTGPNGASATTPTKPKPQKELTPQQKRMKDCSREAKAKGFKGDQRKQFMSGCLKSD